MAGLSSTTSRITLSTGTTIERSIVKCGATGVKIMIDSDASTTGPPAEKL